MQTYAIRIHYCIVTNIIFKIIYEKLWETRININYIRINNFHFMATVSIAEKNLDDIKLNLHHIIFFIKL